VQTRIRAPASQKEFDESEWSMQVVVDTASTHMLALQARIRVQRPHRRVARVDRNASGEAGLVLVGEALVMPGPGVYDGRWETYHAGAVCGRGGGVREGRSKKGTTYAKLYLRPRPGKNNR